ncbi:NPCBM/NEW2 domain protein [Anatilimnocola aggregata]|uniref:NPCBM/NEW2 domain protein n=1 Tax=Anatilimnocola aggregata TaxID=2528021 RepID=A0A517YGL7_9BACT|nr:PVC-type heme-binding CxxCH protein [Anatilimnocola aggregata]QDU29341.1 NPCBM/NEW2 domain protein [Anatilimnocola aggregata]
MSWLVKPLSVLLLGLLLPAVALGADDTGFTSLFDGKSLDGWDGNPDFWSVQDGVITGQTTKEKPTKGNTFLVYRKGDVADFELKLQFKIVGGNSGVQYRSEEVAKHVIKGYQADFDAAGNWAGTLYEEKGRGVLAKRGSKVVVKADGKKEDAGKTAEEKVIVASIKKEDWNDYTIIADGNHIVHKLNGIVTVDLTDEQESARKMSGLLALQLHAGPPMTVQFRNIQIKQLKSADKKPLEQKNGGGGDDEAKKEDSKTKKIIFLAGGPSHGYGSHDHLAGCKLLAAQLEKSLGYKTEVHYRTWPAELSAYDGADCVVMYSDGGGGHPVKKIMETMEKVAKRGTGIVCIHYAVEIPKGSEGGDNFLDWTGGYFEAHWSVNPHWVGKFDKFPDHPICRGVQPFAADDEWYYHMRFRPDMKNVTPILSALPPKETLTRGDGPHSGNPDVRRDVLEKKEIQHMAWAGERDGGGRGFGFTGGHNHWNWGDDNFRKIVLNAIVWSAHGEVPKNGVTGEEVTFEQLNENQDDTRPANFNGKQIIEKFNLKSTGKELPPAKPALPKTSAAPAPKSNVTPLFESKIVSQATPGHAIDIDVDLKGAKKVYLVAADGGDGFGCDWVAWAEPRFVGTAGEKKLTDLKPIVASSGHGSVQMNKNSSGGPLKINGQSVEYGIGCHAISVIGFDVPEGYTRLKTRAGLDDGGIKQGCGSTVDFAIFDQAPGNIKASAPGTAGATAANRDPAEAVNGLEVAEGLEAKLFSSEPQISNVTNIDIDHLGRVWVAEVKNYRKWKGSRPEGDRILVLEDTNEDGVADKQTVFYQGNDIDSIHGLCVLGNRVIVSAGDKVMNFYVDNDDLKSDRKDVMFSGISGTQHDHGIHAFIFGPDGKLYFNFGNSGKSLKDKDGKVIVDAAGNPVTDARKPYQEGMVFRCDLDGSNLETLGWNFRNNWEVTIDSLGTIWQSDNDDDGNKGVRINFVMEYGNYGYKDEFTGAGWQAKRENIEAEIPRRHWHLNDPGVVPNLILTGQGSPTGICVYEGNLLPKVFHNQVIHCDAGPNVCRAYVATKDASGYTAEIVNVLFGKRDNWFRPSDVCVAPDGSLFVADWYDPGVGGHNQQDVDRGRIFRLAPAGTKYKTPKYDFKTPIGQLEALASPALSVRYLAYQAIQKSGEAAAPALIKFAQDNAKDNPRLQARALWALGKLPNQGNVAVKEALQSGNPDIRIVGIRLSRELGQDVGSLASLAKDSAPEVRRELAISTRHSKSPEAAAIWAELAAQHDGKDRWYLEALGIGADKQWDAYLDAYLKKVDGKWDTAAGRDIVWRSRAKQTPALLAKIITADSTKEEEQPRYLRALDFLSGPEKEAALKAILE